jgi:hypothetical protein
VNTPLEQRSPDTKTDEQKTLNQHFPTAKPEDWAITQLEEAEIVNTPTQRSIPAQ